MKALDSSDQVSATPDWNQPLQLLSGNTSLTSTAMSTSSTAQFTPLVVADEFRLVQVAADPDGMASDILMEWQLASSADSWITAITGSSFRYQPDQEGAALRVRVTYQDGQNTQEELIYELGYIPHNNAGQAEFQVVTTQPGGSGDRTIELTSPDPDGNGPMEHHWEQLSSDGSSWETITTGASLQISTADNANRLRVRTTYQDGDGFYESVITPVAGFSNSGQASFAVAIDNNNPYSAGARFLPIPLTDDPDTPTNNNSWAPTYLYRWDAIREGESDWRPLSTSATLNIHDFANERPIHLRLVTSYTDYLGFQETVLTPIEQFRNSGKATIEIKKNEQPSGLAFTPVIKEEDPDSPVDPYLQGQTNYSFQWQRSNGGGAWQDLAVSGHGEGIQTQDLQFALNLDPNTEFRLVTTYTDYLGFQETVITPFDGLTNSGQASFEIETIESTDEVRFRAKIATEDPEQPNTTDFQFQENYIHQWEYNDNDQWLQIENGEEIESWWLAEKVEQYPNTTFRLVSTYTDFLGFEETVVTPVNFTNSGRASFEIEKGNTPNGAVLSVKTATEDPDTPVTDLGEPLFDFQPSYQHTWQFSNYDDQWIDHAGGASINTAQLANRLEQYPNTTFRLVSTYTDYLGFQETVVTPFNFSNSGQASFEIEKENTPNVAVLSVKTATEDPDTPVTDLGEPLFDFQPSYQHTWQFSNYDDQWLNFAGGTGIDTDQLAAELERSPNSEFRLFSTYTDHLGFQETVITPITGFSNSGRASFEIQQVNQNDPSEFSVFTLTEDPDTPVTALGEPLFGFQPSYQHTWEILRTGSDQWETDFITPGATFNPADYPDLDIAELRLSTTYVDYLGFQETVVTPFEVSNSSNAPGITTTTPTTAQFTPLVVADEFRLVQVAADPDGMASDILMEWQLADSADNWITAITGSSFRYQPDQEGTALRVRVTYQDGQNTQEELIYELGTIPHTNAGQAAFQVGSTPSGDSIEYSIALTSPDPDGNGSMEHHWEQLSSDNTLWSVIGTGTSLQRSTSDNNNNIRVRTTYQDGDGFYESVLTPLERPTNSGQATVQIQPLHSSEVPKFQAVVSTEDPDTPLDPGIDFEPYYHHVWQYFSDNGQWNALADGVDVVFAQQLAQINAPIRLLTSYTDYLGFRDTVITPFDDFTNSGQATVAIQPLHSSDDARFKAVVSAEDPDTPLDPGIDFHPHYHHVWQYLSDNGQWNALVDGLDVVPAQQLTQINTPIRLRTSYTDYLGFQETVITPLNDLTNSGQASFGVEIGSNNAYYASARFQPILLEGDPDTPTDNTWTPSYTHRWDAIRQGETDWRALSNSSTLSIDDFSTERLSHLRLVTSYSDYLGFPETVVTPVESFNNNGTARVEIKTIKQPLGIEFTASIKADDPDQPVDPYFETDTNYDFKWQLSSMGDPWEVLDVPGDGSVISNQLLRGELSQDPNAEFRLVTSYTDYLGFSETVITPLETPTNSGQATIQLKRLDHEDGISFRAVVSTDDPDDHIDPNNVFEIQTNYTIRLESSSNGSTWDEHYINNGEIYPESLQTVLKNHPDTAFRFVTTYTDYLGFNETVITPFDRLINSGQAKILITRENTYDGARFKPTVLVDDPDQSTKREGIPSNDYNFQWQRLSIGDWTDIESYYGELNREVLNSHLRNDPNTIFRLVTTYTDDLGFDETIVTPLEDLTNTGQAIIELKSAEATEGLTFTPMVRAEDPETPFDPHLSFQTNYSFKLQSSSSGSSWRDEYSSNGEFHSAVLHAASNNDPNTTFRLVTTYTDYLGFEETVITPVEALTNSGQARWVIREEPQLGKTLHLVNLEPDPEGHRFNPTDGSKQQTIQWQYSPDPTSNSWQDLSSLQSGAQAGLSQPLQDDQLQGQWLRAVITYPDAAGFNETVHVQAGVVPFINDGSATLSINGLPIAGATLSAQKQENDPDSSPSRPEPQSGLQQQWESSSDQLHWSPVQAADGAELKLDHKLVGQFVRHRLNYLDGEGFQEQLVSTPQRIEQAKQQITGQEPVLTYQPGEELQLKLHYTTNNDRDDLNGLVLNVHFNSNLFEFTGAINPLSEQYDIASVSVVDDLDNLDNDPLTNRRIEVTTVSYDRSFAQTPELITLKFNPLVSQQPTDPLTGELQPAAFHYSATETSPGYSFNGTSTHLMQQQFSLDVDQDGAVSALGDGLMVLRKLLGPAFADEALTAGALDGDENFDTEQIHSFIETGIRSGLLDVDDNGKTTALGDGLMVIRYLFGASFEGQLLTEKAISPDSPYYGQDTAWQNVIANIERLMPNPG